MAGVAFPKDVKRIMGFKCGRCGQRFSAHNHDLCCPAVAAVGDTRKWQNSQFQPMSEEAQEAKDARR